MSALALTIATGCGVGYVRFAPGTVGSLLGLAIWAMVPPSPAAQTATLALVVVAGVWSAGVAERQLRQADPGPVVIDEIAGMLLTLWLNPVGWVGAGAGFVVFRIFDVLKPYPADRLERLPGGFGIMADDVMGAIYANLTLRAALMLLPW